MESKDELKTYASVKCCGLRVKLDMVASLPPSKGCHNDGLESVKTTLSPLHSYLGSQIA